MSGFPSNDDASVYAATAAREKELRRLNDELDQKLVIAESSVRKSQASKIPTSADPKTQVDRQPKVTDDASSQLSTASSPRTILTINESEELRYDEDIGNVARRRIQHAQIKTLQCRLREALDLKHESDSTVRELESKLKDIIKENKRLEYALAASNAHMNKNTDQGKSMKETIESVKNENQSLKREVNTLRRLVKDAECEHNRREAQLSRALEEVDKFKKNINDEKVLSKGAVSNSRKEKDDLLGKIKSLQKQRSELLTALKKQMKLIDVLKRQKLHLEASRLLSFREDEFLKILDWDCKASKSSSE